MNFETGDFGGFAGTLAMNSLRAIPLILVLVVLQTLLRFWVAPRGWGLLWLLPLAQLLWPSITWPAVRGFHFPPPPTFVAATEHPLASMDGWLGHLPVMARSGHGWREGLARVWLAGSLAMAGMFLAQGWRFHRRFSGLRPCTDTRLLDLLEDIKEEMGVRIPISLVLSDRVALPVLVGFIRPRILLPASLVKTLGPDELRYVLRHEIAHVRRADIARNWLVSLALALHWFNPFVWLMARRMARAREWACDQAVLGQAQADPLLYGGVMLNLARKPAGPSFMAGVAGIVENKQAMGERIEMLTQTYRKMGTVLTAGLALLLGILFWLNPLRAEAPADEAVTASVETATAWLPVIDAGKYAESYDGFCVMARASLTREKWVEASQRVRNPLGALVSRELASKQYLTALPEGTQGEFVILQYTTEFANFKATETVTTMKDKDGSWHIAGYYIRPRS